MRNILAVQKQSLDLGQKPVQVRSKSLWIVPKKQTLKQKRYHEHYCSDRQNGIEDWVITLIDGADKLKELRRKELYWRYKLKTKNKLDVCHIK